MMGDVAQEQKILMNRMLSALDTLKRKNSELTERRDRLKNGIKICSNLIHGYQDKLSNENFQIHPSNEELTQTRLNKKMKRMVKRKDRDGELTLDLQSLIEDAVVKLCDERQKIGHLEARKQAAMNDLETVVDIVNTLKGNPTPEQHQALVRQRIRESNDTSVSEKRRMINNIEFLKQECDKIETQARHMHMRVSEKNRRITELEEVMADQDEIMFNSQAKREYLADQIALIARHSKQLAAEKLALQNELTEVESNVRKVLDINACYITKFHNKKKQLRNLAVAIKGLSGPLSKQMNKQRMTIHKETFAAIKEAENAILLRESGILDARSDVTKCKREREEATLQAGSIMSELEAQRANWHDMTEHYEGKISAINDLISDFSKTVVYRRGDHSK